MPLSEFIQQQQELGKMKSKKVSERPLVLAEIYEHKSHKFLVAMVLYGGRQLGNVIAPLDEILKEGLTISKKILEIVHTQCEKDVPPPIAFDLHRSNEEILGECTKVQYCVSEMKDEEYMKDCYDLFHQDYVLQAIDDAYIEGYLRQMQKDVIASDHKAEERVTQIYNELRKEKRWYKRAWKKAKQGAIKFYKWLQV